MIRFLVRRVVGGVVLIFVVATVTFALIRLTGTDAARSVAGSSATPAQVARIRAQLGLERPFITQYWHWLSGLVHGNLGTSWTTGDPVSTSLRTELPITLSIILGGLVISALASVIVGVAAAARGGWLDRLVQVVTIVGFAVPPFLIGLGLVLLVAIKWRLLPATGYTPFADSPEMWLESILLPSIALAVGSVAATAQQVRGALLDVLAADYVRTLRARGLSNRSILFRHALRNAAPPALTVFALQFIGLIGGAVVVEKVFGLPGIGSAAIVAGFAGDQPVVLGIVMVTVVLVVIVNVLIDIAYGLLNPKVRIS